MRFLFFHLLILVGTTPSLFGQEGGDVNPGFFPGGPSDIDGTDSRRASKAIRKWSLPGGKQGEQLLSEAPFFWDCSKVGRRVFIRILKNDNRKGVLEVWLENPKNRRYERFKTYGIAYFSGKLGPKTRQGDYQAPEGFYYISRRRLNPASSYHLSLDMGYPNTYDEFHGYTGNFLMIHGGAVSIGCYAMTDCSIEQIYTLVATAIRRGQKVIRVHSFPFAMTDENLSKQRDGDHYDFW